MRITGTFLDEITHDIPANNWDRAQWAAEFRLMREIGIDTVILIRAGGEKPLPTILPAFWSRGLQLAVRMSS